MFIICSLINIISINQTVNTCHSDTQTEERHATFGDKHRLFSDDNMQHNNNNNTHTIQTIKLNVADSKQQQTDNKQTT